MAKRITCDLCGQPAGETAPEIIGTPADGPGEDGEHRRAFDVCRKCYDAWLGWMLEKRGQR